MKPPVIDVWCDYWKDSAPIEMSARRLPAGNYYCAQCGKTGHEVVSPPTQTKEAR